MAAMGNLTEIDKQCFICELNDCKPKSIKCLRNKIENEKENQYRKDYYANRSQVNKSERA